MATANATYNIFTDTSQLPGANAIRLVRNLRISSTTSYNVVLYIQNATIQHKFSPTSSQINLTNNPTAYRGYTGASASGSQSESWTINGLSDQSFGQQVKLARYGFSKSGTINTITSSNLSSTVGETSFYINGDGKVALKTFYWEQNTESFVVKD